MARKAVVIAIDTYEHMYPLQGCVADAIAIEPLLAMNENGTANYTCKHLRSDIAPVTKDLFERALDDLFTAKTEDEVLFYYAGHGVTLGNNVYLASQDGSRAVPGIAMHDLLLRAHRSQAHSVVLILDCCNAGAMGEYLPLEAETDMHFREGMTLLAGASKDEPAREAKNGGIFTQLAISALKGVAKDVRGRVSAAAMYGFIEQALGAWEQRPVFKSNARRYTTIRYCYPDVSFADLQRLPGLFEHPDDLYRLDQRYEFTLPEATPACVEIFQVFKRYRNAGLLKTVIAPDLYFAAKYRSDVQLTPLGQYYWTLAQYQQLEADIAIPDVRRQYMPNAEAVARLFHETYERLAGDFGYKTREATAKPWRDIPEQNKQLMIAVAAEVLRMLFPPEDTLPEPTA